MGSLVAANYMLKRQFMQIAKGESKALGLVAEYC